MPASLVHTAAHGKPNVAAGWGMRPGALHPLPPPPEPTAHNDGSLEAGDVQQSLHLAAAARVAAHVAQPKAANAVLLAARLCTQGKAPGARLGPGSRARLLHQLHALDATLLARVVTQPYCRECCPSTSPRCSRVQGCEFNSVTRLPAGSPCSGAWNEQGGAGKNQTLRPSQVLD